MNDDRTNTVETTQTEESTQTETQTGGEQDYLLQRARMADALLADDRVQEIIRAEQEGRTVQVTPVGESTEAETETETETTETLASEIGGDDDDTQRIVKAVQGVVKTALKPVIKDIEDLKGASQVTLQEKANAQIEAARKKHKDFDEYKAEMVTISRENSNLSAEDLYLVAKSRAGKLNTVEPSTESEKPTATARRRPGERKEPAPRGRRGFQSILTDALEKTT